MKRNEMTLHTDAKTGREVRQLTHFPAGATLDYFRLRKHIADGRIWAHARHGDGELILIDPASGDIEPLPISPGRATVQLQAGGRKLWWFSRAPREVWSVELPYGRPERVATLPEELPGAVSDISCDGTTLVVCNNTAPDFPIPTINDVESIWRYIERPRSGEMWTYHLPTGNAQRILSVDGVCVDHVDTSPVDAGLIRHCLDYYEAIGQRIWCIRADGSERRMIRPQQYGEMVTHEFWWPGGKHIGYTYQDRRNDPTMRANPLCEYAEVPTRFGIADLDGREVFMSEPLNSYHTHILASPDGKWLAGEGTHDHSSLFAAAFSWDSAIVDFKPLATIHTPYVPTRGQQVECHFSADSKWVLFNDTINGKLQIFAVEL